MPTIRDVAKRAGVSISTVSHVLNKTRYVTEPTRQRVLAAIAALNYQPNRLAQGLRSSQSFIIGVLVPNSDNPFFSEVLYGIEAACFDRGYNTILGNAHDDPARERSYIDVLVSMQADGMLLLSSGLAAESSDKLQMHQIPVVCLDPVAQANRFDTVLADNRHGGALVAEYLLSLGHQRISCILGPEGFPASLARWEGFYQTLQAAGIHLEADLIFPGAFDHASGYQACRQLLRQPDLPTAIFALNDMMAVGALQALYEANLRVPEDISVIGFDDVSLAAYTVPGLTTVAQPKEAIGASSVQMLVERINQPDLPLRSEFLPVTLVKRQSCGPAVL